ncbi:MAG TPA: hypothetical protein VKR21_00400 [Solirubrobacteraceae bacterium]|nr:hypothetical protein [Solirubrobacteraceae bacterium]
MTDPHALFRAYQTAQLAFDADATLATLPALEAAERAYYDALYAARAEWNALPDNAAKASAETNACDTEGADENELYWFDIALRTYAMTPEGGW